MLTEIGKLIEAHRKTKKMTQTDLVKIVGIEQSNYSAMIHGHRAINDETLEHIVQLLSIPPVEITQIQGERHDKKRVIANLRKLTHPSIRKLREYSDLLALAEYQQSKKSEES